MAWGLFPLFKFRKALLVADVGHPDYRNGTLQIVIIF